MAIGQFMPIVGSFLPDVEATHLSTQNIPGVLHVSSITFSPVSVPRPGILAVMCATARPGGGVLNITSIEIGGVSVPSVFAGNANTPNPIGAAGRRVSAGSHTIKMNMNSSSGPNFMVAWLLENVREDMPYMSASKVDAVAATSDSFPVNSPAGGFGLFIHQHWGRGNNTTWTGATEIYDAAATEHVQFSAAQQGFSAAVSGHTVIAEFPNQNSGTGGFVCR